MMVVRQAVQLTVDINDSQKDHDSGEARVNRREDMGKIPGIEDEVSVGRTSKVVSTSLEDEWKKESAASPGRNGSMLAGENYWEILIRAWTQ